jgi:hypothetical protein
MVRDDVDGCCRPFGDRTGQLIGVGARRLADRHHPGPGEPDGLLDRCAIGNHVPGLDQNLVAAVTGVGQLLNRVEVGTSDRRGDRERDRR